MDINHVALILDGNRRWARQRNMMSFLGHKEGAKTLETITKEANKKGLKHLTVYVFSTENWKRAKIEVDYLMKLFKIYFKRIIKSTEKEMENIKIDFFSHRENLSKDLIDMINKIEEKTKNNTGLNLHLCFNYGGRQEIIDATKKIIDEVKKGEVQKEDITEEYYEKKLYSKDVPDPDIIIRTSGEQRLSNFLLWQHSYSELFFIDKYWPDFKIEDLEDIIDKYNKRSRRYGK